jgi:hypothetical protein
MDATQIKEAERYRTLMREEERFHTVRLLLGALYSKCGFIHFWNRKSGNMNYATRYEVLEASSSDLEQYGISNEDLRFLVGPFSHYWPVGNPYSQETPKTLRRAAQMLQGVYTSAGGEERARILLAVWRFVTGYDGYVITDYKEGDCGRLTEDGIDDVDIYGEVDLETFYKEMRELID